MVEAGIHGDTVVIKKTDIANHGDIVVALIDEHEGIKDFAQRGWAYWS